MHSASTNHSTTWLINALNTAVVSHQQSEHTLFMACHPAIFLYIHYSMHIYVLTARKGLTGDGSRQRWAVIRRERKEGESHKGNGITWTWMQKGTGWASELRNHPFLFARHFGPYVLYGIRYHSERQYKYHYNRYLLCGLFSQLILMSVLCPLLRCLVSYVHVNKPFWRRDTNLPEYILRMTTLLK